MVVLILRSNAKVINLAHAPRIKTTTFANTPGAQNPNPSLLPIPNAKNGNTFAKSLFLVDVGIKRNQIAVIFAENSVIMPNNVRRDPAAK